MSWNKHEAVKSARLHAGPTSQRRCGHFVSNAIRAGGLNIINTRDAKDMETHLKAVGFKKVYDSPREGDVAIIQGIPGHLSGHACIYDGLGTWYSDFVQRSMYPGSGYRALKPAYQIYRHD